MQTYHLQMCYSAQVIQSYERCLREFDAEIDFYPFAKLAYAHIAKLTLEEEHGPANHTVCAVEFVGGALQIVGSTGLRAPKTWAKALQSVKAAPWGRESDSDWSNGLVKFCDPKFSGLLSRLMVSYSEHP